MISRELPEPERIEREQRESHARRAGIQAAALSMLGALAEALANPRDVSSVLGDLLVHCLDAAGPSTGILYLRDPTGHLRVHRLAGVPENARAAADAGFGHPDLLESVAADQPVAFNRASRDGAQRDLLAHIDRQSALVVPFVIFGKHDGTLLLASDVLDLTDAAWGTFARALAAQSGQEGAQGRARDELAQSDALLRSAMDAAPNGMVMTDSTGRIVMVNRQTERQFGYDHGGPVGQQLETLLPLRFRSAHVGHHGAFLTHPHARPMGVGREFFARHKDGREFPVEIGLAPVTRGDESFVMASVVDISERRRAEERIRWLSLAVEQGPTSVVMTDLEGEIDYVNPKFTEVTGYPLDEVRGKTPRILKSGDTPLETYRELWSSIKDGRPWHGELLNKKKDGTAYWDAVWVYPIRDGSGAVTRFLALKEDITARKNAEQALREREERFTQLADNIKEVFFIQDAEYRNTIYINRAYEAIWGRSCQSLYDNPRSFVDPIPEEDRGPLFASIERNRKGEYAGDVEFRVIRPDGTVRWLLAHAVPVRDEKGEVYRIAGVCSDVTERKKAESELKASEDYHRTILQNIGDAVFIADREGRILDANPRAVELTGYPLDELLGMNVADTYPPADRPAGEQRIATVIGGKASVAERRLLRKDGTILIVETNASLLPDGRMLGTVRDLTERREAEAALRASELRARSLFETVNLIVLGLDQQGRVNYINPFFLKVSGFGADEVIGQDWFRFIPERLRATMQGAFAELIEQRFHPHYENPILTKTGEERTIAWNNTVVRDPHGRAVGTLSIGEDITERNRLELQLRQAQKMEAIGRLAGGVAHDFNNVLTAVFGYIDLLREELPANSGAQEDLTEVRKAAERAASLTRQLLAFSRQQVLEPIVLDPNGLIEDFEKMLRRVIGEDVELRLSLHDNIGNVRVDPGQLHQVIMNLVVNARDAMPTGGKLLIETAHADLTEQYAELHQPVVPGSYVLIAVSDTGTGMTPDVKARIFDPFFTTKEKGKGTGLGLSTVYGIVKQSGGYIWAYSELGRGTTFKVYLPAVDAPAEAIARSRENVSLAGTETILLAEDDAILRPLARELLEK